MLVAAHRMTRPSSTSDIFSLSVGRPVEPQQAHSSTGAVHYGPATQSDLEWAAQSPDNEPEHVSGPSGSVH